MQCWNCGFENLPGLAACGRCASSLSLDAVAIEPPRAYGWSGRSSIERARHRLTGILRRIAALRGAFVALPAEEVTGRVLFCSLVAGLGHIVTGRRLFGGLFLSLWLATLVLLGVSFGTDWQPWALVLVVAVHALSIVAVLTGVLGWHSLSMRAGCGLLTIVGLYFGLYGPVQWIVERFVAPMIVNGVGPGPLVNGDGLLIEGPWLRPKAYQRGDLVFYAIDGQSEHGYIIEGGYGLDRIVAIAGDHVQVHGGELRVNGVPPTPGCTPLWHLPKSVDFEYHVPTGEYVIFASQIPFRIPRGHGDMLYAALRQIAIVRHQQVVGRVWLRLRPLARFGRIQ